MKTVHFNGKSVTPSKIICIGRNYVEHIAELGNEVPDEMVVFIKPNSAISDELKAYHQEPLHYEVEICFMVEKGKFAAVGVGLDLTKRDLQSQLKSKGLPWERAKAFDGSAVFSEETVAVIEGEADVAAKFSTLAFDHLMFTGSTAVGKHVMRAAADNLTPVTLELGGKSPVIIAPDIEIETAVERLIYGKCLNAGQICVAPDYIFCPQDKIEEFISEYQKKYQSMYGNRETSADYANIINTAQHQRILSWLDDAVQKGAKITAANNQSIDRNSRHMATQLITQVNDEMLLMQNEIFGPLLPIIGYEKMDEAIEYINNHPRPLALYVMSFDEDTQQQILSKTHSGGVCINETLMHVAADDAPFGGIGPSGMGHYHGHEGFLTFSKAKTVLKRGKFNTGTLVHPPYGKLIQKLLLKTFLR